MVRASLHYRPDIDGMRALAVIPVCFFHLGLPGFPGGFVGVDVFFVISGYLMGSLIGEDLMEGRFSLLDFYERRARRLLPALFTVLLFTTVAASLWITPKLFTDFGSMLCGTVLFSSNLVLWHMSSNYFSASTDWNPLVHTWSLGVEEQFYILFPLALMAVWRLRPAVRLGLITLAALASLALSIWGTMNAPTATFYLLPMRAWELLIGAIPALGTLLARHHRATANSAPTSVATLACFSGIGLILGSMVLFNSEMLFPGASALVPCVGTVLLLVFGSESATPTTRLLSLHPLRFIGRISYSLYLWHWPLLVLTTKYLALGSAPDLVTRYALLGASIVAAYASWRWIEQPFRERHGSAIPNVPRRVVFGGAALGGAAFAVFGSVAVASNGWAARFPNITAISMERQILKDADNRDWQAYEDEHNRHCFWIPAADWKPDSCFLNHRVGDRTDVGATTALLWGDSFAAAYAAGFFETTRPSVNVLQYTSPQCPPIVGYAAASRPECKAFDERVAEIVRRNDITTVIMAANWSAYLRRHKIQYADIGSTVAFLKSLHVRVILVGQSPVFPFAYPDEYFYRKYGAQHGAGGDYYAPFDADPGVNERIRQSVGAAVDIFFDPLPVWCRDSQCLFKHGDSYLFSDYGHFSRDGSRLAVAALLDATHNLAQAPAGEARPKKSERRLASP